MKESKEGKRNEADDEKWKQLMKEEFALIGIIELPDDGSDVNSRFIEDSLAQWVTDKDSPDNTIVSIMGLKSSIQVPWKHAELSWHWPCSEGREELSQMTDFYRVAMSKRNRLAPMKKKEPEDGTGKGNKSAVE